MSAPWLVLALLAQASPPPAPVSVAATPSRRELTVGEPFTVELVASGPPGTAYVFPDEVAGETVELRPLPPAAGAAPAAPGLRRYQAAAFALGEVRLPPITVGYRLPDGATGEAASPPVELRIGSLLPKDPQQQKLADVRGPLPASAGPAFWAALGLALAVLAALAAWLRARRRRAAAAPLAAPPPPLPPEVEALRALDALAGSGLLPRGEYRGFYIELAVIAKRYLERRLSAPVLEMTTAETLAFLRGHPLGSELLGTLRDLTEAADRIKFARGEGLSAEAERHLASVRSLVRALEARLAPAAPSAQERAA